MNSGFNQTVTKHSVSVKLIYIPGHTGILGNELAGRKAREVAHDISVGDRDLCTQGDRYMMGIE